jgi:ATP-dependent DNA helicase RecG
MIPPQVTPKIEVLLSMLKDGDKSIVEMMKQLGLKDRLNFNDRYLQPALSADLVEMTIPDKPKSKNQRYRLTEKGKNY